MTTRIEAPEHRACRQRADDEHVPARDDHPDDGDHPPVTVDKPVDRERIRP